MEDEESSSEDSSDNSLNNLYLRKASSEDVDKIIKIYNKSRDYLDEEDEEWIRSIVSSRSRRIKAYVLKENEVKAFAIVYKKNDVAYIDALAVDPEYRGRGLGTLFLRSLELMLRKEGFKKILLTVKHHNLKALSLYLKHGYRIRNMVLVLEASDQEKIRSIYSLNFNKDVRFKIYTYSRKYLRKKMLETAVWSIYTGDVDELIYMKSRENRIILTAYEGKILIGMAVISLDKDILEVERLALSYHETIESLMTIMRGIYDLSEILSKKDYRILIPVDASKNLILNTLMILGFRVVDSEYVLTKDLAENLLSIKILQQIS